MSFSGEEDDYLTLAPWIADSTNAIYWHLDSLALRATIGP